MSRILPILFNTDMVRAILDGRKTVTRRPCKDGTEYTVPDMDFYNADKRTYAVHSYADKEHTWSKKLSIAERTLPICPGDILYVREAFRYVSIGEVSYEGEGLWDKEVIEYMASPEEFQAKYGCYIGDFDAWKPSIHMPKEAARIWLKVTDVRVERLQDITEEQAKAEGADFYTPKLETENGIRAWSMATARTKFCGLWDSTCKKNLQIHGWNVNPWAWVIEFERCEKPD